MRTADAFQSGFASCLRSAPGANCPGSRLLICHAGLDPDFSKYPLDTGVRRYGELRPHVSGPGSERGVTFMGQRDGLKLRITRCPAPRFQSVSYRAAKTPSGRTYFLADCLARHVRRGQPQRILLQDFIRHRPMVAAAAFGARLERGQDTVIDVPGDARLAGHPGWQLRRTLHVLGRSMRRPRKTPTRLPAGRSNVVPELSSPRRTRTGLLSTSLKSTIPQPLTEA